MISRFQQLLHDLAPYFSLGALFTSKQFYLLQADTDMHPIFLHLVSVPIRNFSDQIPGLAGAQSSVTPCVSDFPQPCWVSSGLVGPKKFSKRLWWPHRMALHRSFQDSSSSSLPPFAFSAKAPTPPPTPPLRTLQTFHKHFWYLFEGERERNWENLSRDITGWRSVFNIVRQ